MKNFKQICIGAITAAMMLGGIACAPVSGTSMNIAEGELAFDEDFVCTITVDGGGQWANYNTTPSMEQSETNPYPYNTLEKLCEEYSDLHPNVTIKLNKQSYNADGGTLRSLFSTNSAPDILYNTTTTLGEDYNKNYYANLGEYLKLPNRYSKEGERGFEKWYDIFGDDLKGLSDGRNFYVCMERGVMGFIYNKTFFERHGLETPDTYSEFLELIETIHAKDADVVPYMATAYALDKMYEGAMYIDCMNEIDENKDGWTDAYEMTKAYKVGIFDFEDERYRLLTELLDKRLKYSPDFNKVTPSDAFLMQNTMMYESSGNDMAMISRYAEDRGFEVGFFPFPLLDAASAEGLENFIEDGVGIRRGSSGLCTAWFVTNHAFASSNAEVNLKKINACADFLMFLTAKTNNDRMVNDKGVAVPLSGEVGEKTEIFKPLIDQYMSDFDNENMWSWDTFTPNATMGANFYNTWVSARNDYYYGAGGERLKGDMNAFIKALRNGMDGAADKMIKLNGWDTSKW